MAPCSPVALGNYLLYSNPLLIYKLNNMKQQKMKKWAKMVSKQPQMTKIWAHRCL